MLHRRAFCVSSWSRKLLDQLARLRRWRRSAWMSRVPWLWPAGQIVARSKTPLVTPTRLALEQLERRETPNDVLSLLQGGFAWGGLLLVNKLDTPASVAMKGWTPASLPLAPAPAPTTISDAYTATPWETAQEVPWTPQVLGLSPTETSEAAAPSTNHPLVMGPSEQQSAQPISDDAWRDWGKESQTPTHPRGLGKSSVENNAAGGGGSPQRTPGNAGAFAPSSGGSLLNAGNSSGANANGSTAPSGSSVPTASANSPSSSPFIFANAQTATTPTAGASAVPPPMTVPANLGSKAASATDASANSSANGGPGHGQVTPTANWVQDTNALFSPRIPSSGDPAFTGPTTGHFTSALGASCDISGTMNGAYTTTSIAATYNGTFSNCVGTFGVVNNGDNLSGTIYNGSVSGSSWSGNFFWKDTNTGTTFQGSISGTLGSSTLTGSISSGTVEPIGVTFNANITCTFQTQLSGYPRSTDPLQGSTVAAGNASISPQSGNLSTGVPLQLSLNALADDGSDRLVYNVNNVTQTPILEADFQLPSSDGVPTQIQAQLTWNGTAGSWLNFSTTGHSAGDTYVLDLQAPSAVSSTSFNPWKIEIKATLSGHPNVDDTYTGTDFVNILGTPFGNGWTLSSLDHLVVSGANVAFVYGSGGYRVFTSNGNGTYTAPANDFGTLTSATVGSVTSYTYSLNGTTETFTQAGLLDHTTFPDGKVATYVYSSGALTQVHKPDGSVSTFVYSGSLISSIQEPGGLVVTLTHSSNNLTGVATPDGNLYTYSYDANNRMQTNALGQTLATYAYDSTSGLISSTNLGGGETSSVAPAAAQAVGASDPPTIAQIGGVVTNASNQATTYVYDALGRPTQETTADGATQSWQHDTAGDVTVATDANNNVTSLTYDNSGDVLTQTSPNGSVSSYQYNSTFHEVTQAVDGHGNTSTYQYNASGEMTGAIDPQGNVTTQAWSSGLLQNVEDPRGDTVTYTYNASQQMTAETTAAGTSSYSYDSAGNVQTMTDPLGHVTSSTYDGMGRLLTQTTPDGGVTSYIYDAAGDMLSVTNPLGQVTSYGYDSRGDQTSVTEAYGTAIARTTTNVYNSLGELLSTEDANGNITSYAYNPLGRQTEEIDAYGTSVQRIATTVYDAAGNVLSKTDENGNITSYAYDSLNREIEEIDGYGTAIATTTTMIYDAAGNLLSETTGQSTTAAYAHASTTSYAYDSLNRQTEEIDAYGTSVQRITTTVYDAAGNVLSTKNANGVVTSYAYDTLNRKIEEIDAYGTAVASTTTMIYDADGNLLSETTGQSTTVAYAHSSTTSYAYDVLNRQTEQILGYGTSAAATIHTAYDLGGNVLSTTDADGNVTSYSYNALNQQTEKIQGCGTAVASTTTMLYDAVGNLLSETTGQSTTAAYANASTTSYAYDALNRKTEEINAYGTSIASTTTMIYDAVGNLLSETTGQSTTVAYAHPSTTSYAYDALNRQTQEIDAYGVAGVQRTTSTVYDAAGNVVQSYDALGHVTSYTYDALNQQITEQTPAGGTATTVYDTAGNVLAQIDQLSHATSYSYDALNRQITETDGDRNTTTCAYDAAGNQISLTDADNNTTTMVYDALNRQISETDPLNHTSTAVYDAANNLISTTDRDGRLETFSYDTLNRKTGATWIVSGSTTNVQTFTYDAATNPLTAADYNGAYTMAYDALNRMTSDQEPFGQALTFIYDAANNQIQVQDSQGGTTTSVYNALNELATREFGGTSQTPLREDLTYTALGQIATETRYTDLAGTQVAGTSSYVYDTDGRLTNLAQTYANGSVLASYVYNYNQASLLTSEVDDGVTTSYSYDNANQLTQAGTATYGYDATGNRTNTGYQTGPDNQLLSDGTYSYTYDNEGNLATKKAGNDITTYSYNNQNELIGVIETVGGTLTMQTTYVYDVFGNRLEADDYKGGVTTITRSAYNGSNAWEDLNGSNALQMRYFYLDGQNQMLARVDSAGNLAWYGTDHLGSVRIVLNAAGTTVLDQITYDANGNITSESSPGNRGAYGFAGYVLDTATGLDKAGWREYAPWIGVWTTQDPIQFAGGNPNLYGYVNNDPTDLIDPRGLDRVPPIPQPAIDAGKAVGTGIGAWLWGSLSWTTVVTVGAVAVPVVVAGGSILIIKDVGGITTSIGEVLAGPPKQFAPPDISQLPGLPESKGGPAPQPNPKPAPSETKKGTGTGTKQSKNVCFAAGTPVLTSDGYKPIEKLQPGDRVLARPEEDVLAKAEFKVVEDAFVAASPVIRVRVQSRDIRTTAEHPFFVVGQGWRPANELRPGDLLSSHDGQVVTVDEVGETGEEVPVYNVRVADYHTYFVGCDEWGFSAWAHNTCWYHGTDSSETVSTKGLNEADFLAHEPEESKKGFFVTPNEAYARLVAVAKTDIRNWTNKTTNTPVLLVADDAVIRPFLKPTNFTNIFGIPEEGEMYIPVEDFDKVPRNAFRRLP